jgi:hypothetical protein
MTLLLTAPSRHMIQQSRDRIRRSWTAQESEVRRELACLRQEALWAIVEPLLRRAHYGTHKPRNAAVAIS